MKIMFAVATYWPSQDGVANVTQYLAEGLAVHGHEVYVLTSATVLGDSRFPNKESHNQVCIERFSIKVRWPLWIKGLNAESSKEAYKRKVLEFKPDVLIIVCAQTWPLDWACSFLDEIECPKVFYSHGYSGWKQKYQIQELLKQRNVIGVYAEWKAKRYFECLYKKLDKFDLILHLSEINSSYIYSERYGLKKNKVLENAVEDFFADMYIENRKDAFDRQTLQFLCVANYNDNKNQMMILKAFSEAKIKNASLHFVGSAKNEYLMDLQAYWNAHKQEEKQVVFHVQIPREQVYVLYQESQVYLCASKSENCPIVHREAAAIGMPIISTNVGDVSLFDGIILVNNQEEMKEQIERVWKDRGVLRQSSDKLYKYMSKKNIKVSDKVTWLENELENINQKSREK